MLAVGKYIIRQCRISYRDSDISLKNATIYDIIPMKEGAFVSENKLLDLSLEIALKESNETSYWLKLMYETKRIDLESYQYAEKLCGNIRRLLIASCRTAKENAK